MKQLAWAIILFIAGCVVVAWVLAYLVVTPAWPQAPGMPCGDADKMAEHLTAKYGEQPAEVGVSPNGGLVVLFLNPETRTFTVMLRAPTGTACLAASGEDWEAKAATPLGQGT